MKTLIFALLLTVSLCADSDRFGGGDGTNFDELKEPFVGGISNEQFPGEVGKKPLTNIGGLNREPFPGEMGTPPYPGGMGKQPFPGGMGSESFPGAMGKPPYPGGRGPERFPGGMDKETYPGAGPDFGRSDSFENKDGMGSLGNGGFGMQNSMFGYNGRPMQYYTSMGILPVPGSGLCTCPPEMQRGNNGMYPDGEVMGGNMMGGNMMGGNMMGGGMMGNRPGRFPNNRDRYEFNRGMSRGGNNGPFLGARGNFDTEEDKKKDVAAKVPEKKTDTKPAAKKEEKTR